METSHAATQESSDRIHDCKIIVYPDFSGFPYDRSEFETAGLPAVARVYIEIWLLSYFKVTTSESFRWRAVVLFGLISRAQVTVKLCKLEK